MPDKIDSNAPPTAGNTPPPTPKKANKARSAATQKSATPAASNLHSTDHIQPPANGPISQGDSLEPTTSGTPATSQKQSVKQLSKQALGSSTALITGKTLLKIGTLSFLRNMFEQMRPGEKPVSAMGTVGRMAASAAVGAAIMLAASGIPCGIVGAALSAAGPAAIPIFAVIAACVVYGAVCGAYQGYKSTRLPEDGKMPEVTLTKDDNLSVGLTREPGVSLTATSIKPQLKPPADMSATHTRVFDDDDAKTSDADKGADPNAAAADANALHDEEKERRSQNAAAAGLNQQAQQTLDAKLRS